MKATRREIRELAASIYARIAPSAAITDKNIKGVQMYMEAARNHAELFYEFMDKEDKAADLNKQEADSD